jgi:uncharacterized protein with PIN domain
MDRELHVAAVMELDGGTLEQVAEFLHHSYYKECVARTENCPKCGGQLRTWRAKQCLHCGHDWHAAVASFP